MLEAMGHRMIGFIACAAVAISFIPSVSARMQDIAGMSAAETASIVVQVLDPNDDPVPGAVVTLAVPRRNPSDARDELVQTVLESGFVRFIGLAPGRCELTVTASGFPTYRSVIDLQAGSSPDAVFVCRLGIPCDGEAPSPSLVLGIQDREAILADLVDRAKTSRGLTVLLDENIEVLKPSGHQYRGLIVLGEEAMLKRSRGRVVTFVRLSEVGQRGTCVWASYSIGCVENRAYCSLCCEGASVVYRKSEGVWKGEKHMSWVS